MFSFISKIFKNASKTEPLPVVGGVYKSRSPSNPFREHLRWKVLDVKTDRNGTWVKVQEISSDKAYVVQLWLFNTVWCLADN